MNIEPQDIVRTRQQAARGLSIGHFAMGLAGEIVDVVERMHGTISRTPLPFDSDANDRAFGLTGFIYRAIRSSFGHLETGLAHASQALHDDPHSQDPGWIMSVAAINGVCGDLLAAKASPLALSMQLIGDEEPAAHRVVFLHGLCMSEHGWQKEAHPEFAQWLRTDRNASVHYLRYNSGLHISDNGEALAELLEREAATAEALTLIGHSMGGLLIRSALHAAAQRQHSWPDKLQHTAMLGSPHHGSPLERLGNRANSLLKISPYIKPFSRLGNLRSAGIRDLRFGNITAEDWALSADPDHFDDLREHQPLPEGPSYLLMAASLSEELPDEIWRARHDYLVPVASALGLSRHEHKTMQAPALDRITLKAVNHMELLHNRRVYDALKKWLENA